MCESFLFLPSLPPSSPIVALQNRALIAAIRRLLPLSSSQDEGSERKWVKFLEMVFDHNLGKLSAPPKATK